MNFLKNQFFPKIITINWFIFFVIFQILKPLFLVRNILFGIDKKKSIVCIEAGIQGWNSIELKELLQSSIEYLDSSSVIKLSINRNNSYLLQVIELLRNKNITHYIYTTQGQAVRTGFLDLYKAS